MAPIFGAFFTPKLHFFFNLFLDGFLEDFEPPDPPRWSSRLHEALILRKSPFSFQTRFWMKFGGKLSSKRVQKSFQKSTRKINVFSLQTIVVFDPHLSANGGQHGSNGRQKKGQNGYLEREFQKGTEKEVKLSPNGAEIKQKSIEL